MTLISKRCQAVSRWTPATGGHRNHIPKDYDEAAELDQGGRGYSPLAGSTPERKLRVTGNSGSGLLILAHSFYLELLYNPLI